MYEALPIAVAASPGSVVSLGTVLAQAFGSSLGGYQDFWLTYEGTTWLLENDFSYWNLANEVPSSWYVNGQDIGEDFSNQAHVNLAQIGSANLHMAMTSGDLSI